MSFTSSLAPEENPLKEDRFKLLLYYFMITLSICGQLFTIITYHRIKNKNNRFFEYVAWHAIIGLPWMLTYYFSVSFAYKEEASCKIVGFITSFTYSAFMYWSSMIAWSIHSSLKSQAKLSPVHWHKIAGVYILSIFTMAPTVIDGNFGAISGQGVQYCWFKDVSLNISMTISYYGPLVLTTCYNLYCYIASSIIVKKTGNKEVTKEFHSLLMFPIIFVFCNSGAVIKKLSVVLGNGYTTPWEILHLFLAKGQSLFEALAYGFHPTVRKEIKKAWAPCSKAKAAPGETPLFDGSSIEKQLQARNQRVIQLEL